MVLFRDMGDQGQQQREARTTQKGQELQRWLSKPWRRGHARGHSLRAAKGPCCPRSCQPEEEKRCIFKSVLNLLHTCGCSTHPRPSLVLCLVGLLWNRQNTEALGELKWVSSEFVLRCFAPLTKRFTWSCRWQVTDPVNYFTAGESAKAKAEKTEAVLPQGK